MNSKALGISATNSSAAPISSTQPTFRVWLMMRFPQVNSFGTRSCAPHPRSVGVVSARSVERQRGAEARTGGVHRGDLGGRAGGLTGPDGHADLREERLESPGGDHAHGYRVRRGEVGVRDLPWPELRPFPRAG